MWVLSFFSFALHNACSGDFGCLVYVMLTLNTKYFDVCLFFDIPATFTLWKIGIFSWHVPLPNLSEDTESVFSVSKTSVCCLSAVLSTRLTSDSQCLSCQTAKPGPYASNKCPNEIPESTSAKWIQVPKVLVYYSMSIRIIQSFLLWYIVTLECNSIHVLGKKNAPHIRDFQAPPNKSCMRKFLPTW